MTGDVNSAFRTYRCYAKKGERVMLIARYGRTWIVEGKGGQRFPVNANKLKPIENEKNNQESKG